MRTTSTSGFPDRPTPLGTACSRSLEDRAPPHPRCGDIPTAGTSATSRSILTPLTQVPSDNRLTRLAARGERRRPLYALQAPPSEPAAVPTLTVRRLDAIGGEPGADALMAVVGGQTAAGSRCRRRPQWPVPVEPSPHPASARHAPTCARSSLAPSATTADASIKPFRGPGDRPPVVDDEPASQ